MTQPIAIFGESLVDCFPQGERVLGGAPFNVAWHLQALQQPTHFISRVGQDANGLAIRHAMLAWGMTVADLQTDSHHATGTVQVSFEQNQPHYHILANQAYDFIDKNLLVNRDYSVLYHGTLALRNNISANALAQLIQKHTGKIFLDVNLRAPWWIMNQVEHALQKTHWLKLNDVELQHWQKNAESLQDTMHRLLNDYALETIIVTQAEKGAIALQQDGEYIRVSPANSVEVVDTVGAGDAFSAVLLLGLQRGWSLKLL